MWQAWRVTVDTAKQPGSKSATRHGHMTGHGWQVYSVTEDTSQESGGRPPLKVVFLELGMTPSQLATDHHTTSRWAWPTRRGADPYSTDASAQVFM